MRRPLIFTFVAAIVLAVASPAHAGTHLDEAVAAVKQSRVYVAKGTEGTDANTAAAITGQLNDDDYIIVAMLPADAASEFGAQDQAQAFADQLDDATGHSHIVAVSIGNQRAASSHLLPTGTAADLMSRAVSVTTNTRESLITFIRNVHSWLSDHPEVVASLKAKVSQAAGSSKSRGFPYVAFVSMLASLIGFGLTVLAWRRRRNETANGGLPQVKLESPDRLHDELRAILDARPLIYDHRLRDLITQLVRDTEEVFRRLRECSPDEVDTEAILFESHLQSLQRVLKQYVDIQNNPRYYINPDASMADGRNAVENFAHYALVSAQRAGENKLSSFKVDTKILQTARDPHWYFSDGR